ncbi:MAG: hypothetical protein PQ975_07475 [Methanobacterium sp.]|jgi:uncharacterized protein YwgA
MEDVPRCWPVLYSLYKLNRIEGHFFLQKYIYLAKVEENVSIDYEFVKGDYGPYSTGIKSDALVLDQEGFIEMIDVGRKWVFEITDKGKSLTEKLLKKIPKNDIKGIESVLEKFSSYSLLNLKEYVYKNHVRNEKENNQLKKQMLIDIADLLSIFRKYESSDNSLFLRGSLDYCSVLLKKENIKDKVKKDIFISSVSSYIKEIIELNDLILNKPEFLSYLNLKDHKEKFDFIQDLCSEKFQILPRLDDDNIDLELFFDDKDDSATSDLLTSII